MKKCTSKNSGKYRKYVTTNFRLMHQNATKELYNIRFLGNTKSQHLMYWTAPVGKINIAGEQINL